MDYKKGLLNDIFKYSNEEDPEYNILKATKRLWSYAAFLVKTKLDVNIGNDILKLISPIMDSYIAVLNSTKADLEVLQLLLTNNLDIPDEYIKLSIQSISLRLACYCGKDNMGNITKQILLKFDPVKDDFDVQALNEAMSFIKQVISKLTKEYLKCKGVDIRKILLILP
jgi:di/tripeptidase